MRKFKEYKEGLSRFIVINSSFIPVSSVAVTKSGS